MWYNIKKMSFEQYSKLYPDKGARASCESYILTIPISEITQKERKMLLGFGTFGILIAKAGLVPTKISALGIEFTETNREAVVIIASLLVLYFLFAFIIYSLSDIFKWHIDSRRAVIHSLEDQRIEKKQIDFDQPKPRDEKLREQEQIQKVIDYEMEKLGKLRVFFIPITFIKGFFDFLLPILIGIYAIFALLTLSN